MAGFEMFWKIEDDFIDDQIDDQNQEQHGVATA